MNAEKLAIKNDSVKYIEMSDVVEHVDDAPLCLAEGARVLRAGGWATISVPTALSERLLLRLRPSYSDEIGHKNIFEEK
jgi:ubiquinone/menaquinone biosynthesis C-methylase UbiE